LRCVWCHMSMEINKEFVIRELLEIKDLLIRFFRSPVEQIKSVPDWPWAKVITFQIAFTAICGALSAVVAGNWLGVFGEAFLRPILTVIMVSLLTLFSRYFSKSSHKRTCPGENSILLSSLLTYWIFFSQLPFLNFLSSSWLAMQ